MTFRAFSCVSVRHTGLHICMIVQCTWGLGLWTSLIVYSVEWDVWSLGQTGQKRKEETNWLNQQSLRGFRTTVTSSNSLFKMIDEKGGGGRIGGNVKRLLLFFISCFCWSVPVWPWTPRIKGLCKIHVFTLHLSLHYWLILSSSK